jgi:hypothetical protein
VLVLGGGTGVFVVVGGATVLVAGTAVLVGGTSVLVGGIGVLVLVGGMGELVGVAVGGAIPFPTRDTLCGLSHALSLMRSTALLGPVLLGAKLRLIVQLALGATAISLQASDSAKLAVAVPVRVMLLTVKLRAPVLVMMTVWVTLRVPSSWLPKSTLLVLSGPFHNRL